MIDNTIDEGFVEEEIIAGEPETPNSGGDETPKNETISKDKFDEIDRARRTFYEENKRLKSKLKEFESNPRKEGSNDWRERVDFLLVNRDFNKQEFDHISAVSKRDNVSLQEAAEKEMDYISFRRKQEEDKNKIPSSSAAKGSSFRKSEADIRKMTSAELQEYEAQLEQADEGGQI